MASQNGVSGSQGAAAVFDASAGENGLLSSHRMSRKEMLQGVANRFVFSRCAGTSILSLHYPLGLAHRLYILLYLGMAGLSLATVVLSLLSDCPTVAWYIIEVIINVALVAEVSIRLFAFGKSFFKSHWNTLDLIISIFCVVTILVVFSNGCAGKGEEILDTFILVARNLLQFGRLALIFRRSGKSIFSTIPAVHLDGARNASFSLDLDFDDEEAIDAVQRRASFGRGDGTEATISAKSTPRDAQQPFSLSGGESDDER